MGLASKIKASNSATPQSSQPPAPSDAGYAPAYDYPPAQHDSRYGAPPAADYPKQGAPSAPPAPQQYYASAYPSPYQQSRPESTPYAPSVYGAQGKTPPYGGQGYSSPYGDQGHAAVAQPSVYGGQGYPPSGAQPSYAQPATQPTSPYGRQGYSSPYGEQVLPGTQPSYSKPGTQPSYGGGGYGAAQYPPVPAQYQQASHQNAANNTGMIAQKLQAIIQANRLESFYDPGRLQATVQKVASINFAEIAAQWKISKELAYDLAPLALYDIVFYCDDSGSMAFEENGERIDDLKYILSKVSGIATLFDDDGIMVRFMNSDVNGDGIRSAADVANLISKVRFSGMTPLGTNLDRKVIQPFVLRQAMSNMAKPVLAIAVTDGEPSGEDRGTIRQVIYRAKDALKRTQYGDGALAVQIAQVGKDANTQKFLESLDTDPVIGNMIDCTSYYELEEAEFARKGVVLSPELWLLKMCVGAIDPDYDSRDD